MAKSSPWRPKAVGALRTLFDVCQRKETALPDWTDCIKNWGKSSRILKTTREKYDKSDYHWTEVLLSIVSHMAEAALCTLLTCTSHHENAWPAANVGMSVASQRRTRRNHLTGGEITTPNWPAKAFGSSLGGQPYPTALLHPIAPYCPSPSLTRYAKCIGDASRCSQALRPFLKLGHLTCVTRCLRTRKNYWNLCIFRSRWIQKKEKLTNPNTVT